MSNYALVKGGIVENVVVWDGDSYTPATDSQPAHGWSPPEGYDAIPLDAGSIVGAGWAYDGTTFVAPSEAGPTLAEMQALKMSDLYAAYQTASQVPVDYKSVGGIDKTYQADSASQSTLLIATTGYNMAGATPDGFYWVAADNTQVPFALDDLRGLYAAMLVQGNAAFNKLQSLKAAVRSATKAADVQSVSW